MTDKPTPKEIDDLVYELRQAGTDDTYSLVCAVLAKWGTPAPTRAGEVVAWVDERAIGWLKNSRAHSATITTALGKAKSYERPMPLHGTPQPTQPQAWAVTDAQVLAAVRVVSPNLFRHGLQPLPHDGANTAAQMRKEADTVRKMLEAAHVVVQEALAGTEAAKQRQLASTTVQDIAARLQEPMP